MTDEELERIKSAYYSGLKIQIWFNGYWKDFDIREYSMYPEPFCKNRQYRIVGSEYAKKAEERIKVLEEAKEALTKDKDYFSDALDKQIEATLELHKENEELKEQLLKAKEILKKFLDAKNIEETCVAESEAEKFLKEYRRNDL